MDGDLLSDIRAAIDAPDSQVIDGLFVRLFERHYELNESYRWFCDANGAVPGTMRSWRDIPAAPTAAFRAFDLSCAPIANCLTEFHSSGTTGAGASRHYMDKDAVRLYEHSLRRGYERAMTAAAVAPNQPIWALMPGTHTAPHSSLSHMLAALGAERWFWDDWSALAAALDDVVLAGKPVTVFGTAIAFASAFESFAGRQWMLPAGSAVIETGGFKGSSKVIAREDLYRQLADVFGVPDSACVAEYGMCELSSQYYSVGVDGAFGSPPWLRTRLIDPLTGDDVADGQEGVLLHYDLANWNSVAAVQTLDVAVAAPGGGFRLLGRAAGAEVRGCSLLVP